MEFWGNPVMDMHLMQGHAGESRNTPSGFMLQKANENTESESITCFIGDARNRPKRTHMVHTQNMALTLISTIAI